MTHSVNTFQTPVDLLSQSNRFTIMMSHLTFGQTLDEGGLPMSQPTISWPFRAFRAPDFEYADDPDDADVKNNDTRQAQIHQKATYQVGQGHPSFNNPDNIHPFFRQGTETNPGRVVDTGRDQFRLNPYDHPSGDPRIINRRQQGRRPTNAPNALPGSQSITGTTNTGKRRRVSAREAGLSSSRWRNEEVDYVYQYLRHHVELLGQRVDVAFWTEFFHAFTTTFPPPDTEPMRRNQRNFQSDIEAEPGCVMVFESVAQDDEEPIFLPRSNLKWHPEEEHFLLDYVRQNWTPQMSTTRVPAEFWARFQFAFNNRFVGRCLPDETQPQNARSQRAITTRAKRNEETCGIMGSQVAPSSWGFSGGRKKHNPAAPASETEETMSKAPAKKRRRRHQHRAPDRLADNFNLDLDEEMTLAVAMDHETNVGDRSGNSIEATQWTIPESEEPRRPDDRRNYGNMRPPATRTSRRQSCSNSHIHPNDQEEGHATSGQDIRSFRRQSGATTGEDEVALFGGSSPTRSGAIYSGGESASDWPNLRPRHFHSETVDTEYSSSASKHNLRSHRHELRAAYSEDESALSRYNLRHVASKLDIP